MGVSTAIESLSMHCRRRVVRTKNSGSDGRDTWLLIKDLWVCGERRVRLELVLWRKWRKEESAKRPPVPIVQPL